MYSKILFFSNVLTLYFIGIFGCNQKETLVPAPIENVMTTPKDSTGISYLALGDSYTKAECEIPENGYPAILVDTLIQQNISVTSYKVIAQTGWRTDNLKNALNAAELQDTFDLVSLLIGVNNQYQGKSPDAYRIEFRELLELAIFYARGDKDRVFVLSIPDYGVTLFGSANENYISQQIDLFNQINKEVTDSLGVTYFDITPISREAKTDPTLTCTDNLHPSGKMYKRWVDLITPKVIQMAK